MSGTVALSQYLEQVAVRLLAICYRWPHHIPMIRAIIRSFPSSATKTVAGALVSAHDPDLGLDVPQFMVLTSSENDTADAVIETSEGADMVAHEQDPTMVMMYVRSLVEGAEQVRLSRILRALSDAALQAGSSIEDIRARVMSAVQGYGPTDGDQELAALKEQCDEDVTAWETGEIDTEVTCGLQSLDAMLRFPRGNLSAFGALSGAGKTIFGVQMALHNAKQIVLMGLKNARVLYFSAEMTAPEIMHRMAAHESGYTENYLRETGDPNGFKAYREALHFVTTLPIIIDDTVGPTTEYVHAKCAQVRAMHDLWLIVFDHTEKVWVGNIPAEDPGTLSIAVSSFKNTAKAFGAHFLTLHQYNRNLAFRDDKRPQMTDLRGSARIEHESYGVMLLHSELALSDHGAIPAPRKLANGAYPVIIDVAKHRNGRKGEVKLGIDPERMRFVEPDAPKYVAPDPGRQLDLVESHDDEAPF